MSGARSMYTRAGPVCMRRFDALKEFTIEKSLDAMEAEWKEPPP